MEKLKEQYDAELQALRESVEEATQVSPPHWLVSRGGYWDGQEKVAWEQITGLPHQCQWSCFLICYRVNFHHGNRAYSQNKVNSAAVDYFKAINLNIAKVIGSTLLYQVRLG